MSDSDNRSSTCGILCIYGINMGNPWTIRKKQKEKTWNQNQYCTLKSIYIYIYVFPYFPIVSHISSHRSSHFPHICHGFCCPLKGSLHLRAFRELHFLMGRGETLKKPWDSMGFEPSKIGTSWKNTMRWEYHGNLIGICIYIYMNII